MEKNERKTNYSIKSKLVSAIAMLLVATIMVVSSTYAWFTLSTAPEVTGISTAVGANGALEMLLATWNDEKNDWDFGTGSVNGKSTVERNTFWGNLVNLSDPSYGSQAITLYPSKLNLNNDGKFSLLLPLQTPSFGADGRVENLVSGGDFAKYNASKNNFVPGDKDYGFRAVGVASGLTERQQAFRSAISAMATARYNAQTEARNSLSNNGTTLASIAILKAMSAAEKPYNDTHIAAINSMITGLETSLKQTEEAYIQAIIAYSLSTLMNHADDTVANAYAAEIRSAATIDNAVLDARLNAVFEKIGEEASTTVKASLNGYDAYKAAVTALIGNGVDVEGAKDLAEGLSGTEFGWGDISPALMKLVDVDKITINGVLAKDVKEEENKNKIASDIIGGKGVKVNIPTGGGVYADIADLCGDYTVDINIKSDDLNVGVHDLTISATMTADSTRNNGENPSDPYLTEINKTISAKEPSGTTAGALPLTELYGYVIDLAFRTNAAQSNLLLQTEAIDRIYNNNNNEQTMGSGSTMTFKSSASDFTTAKVKELMSNIRVVFYSTVGDGEFAEVYATAKLDVVNGVVEDANGVTAKLYIYKNATATKYVKDTTTYYKVDNTFYSGLPCSDSTKLTTAPDVTGFTESSVEVEVRDNVITALNQGEIKHISALVYLDGESIENDDVAATVAQSMTGTVNLQFASSAALVPMEYGSLHTVNNNQNAGN
ncbi:MAG: hypothetical protein E7539_01745 [Ruminococcaceae bacterium]|nr:hypothetical protein [Oscillospiraceae bacterium]